MDRYELKRMFDRLAPSQEQEEAGLGRLLQTERKVYPVKKLKKLAVASIAAAIMLVTCAAAVVTGIDQRLLDFMGWSSQAQELLVPGAMAVDITAEDNGATLHITQVLRDRYSIMVIGDFIAPEGTVLEVEVGAAPFDKFRETPAPQLLDGDGAPMWGYSVSWRNVVLEDEDPHDNRLSLLFTIGTLGGGEIGKAAKGLALTNIDVVQLDREKMEEVPIYTGDWSCEVPLPQNDTGWSQQTGTVLELADTTVYEKEIYLSPMTFACTIEMDEGLSNEEKNRIKDLFFSAYEYTLTDRNGREVALSFAGGSRTLDECMSLFQVPEIIDPAQFQGGTFSFKIDGQLFAIPLDSLAPVAE